MILKTKFLLIIFLFSALSACRFSGHLVIPSRNLNSLTVTGSAVYAPSTSSQRASETLIIQLTGIYPAGTSFAYSSTDGIITGAGSRVNFTPYDSAAGSTSYVNATATYGSATGSALIPVRVTAPRPRVVIDSVVTAGTSTITGHLLNVSFPLSTRMAAYKHVDAFYNLAGNPFAVNANGTFTISGIIFPANMNRVTLELIDSSFNPDVSGCNNGSAGTCGGVYESLYNSKNVIPFDLTGTTSLAYAPYVYPQGIVNANPQIQNILNRFSLVATAGAAVPAYLIRSFATSDQFYLYDQGLAVIALSKAGMQAEAQRILNALLNVQRADGSWYFSYNLDGTSIYPAGGDRRTAGSIAWAVMGINAYHKAFSSVAYDAMAKKALDYLTTQRISVTYNGVTSNPVKFGATNIGPFDQTKIASVEHNLDAYSAYRMYATLTVSPAYQTIADDLRQFIESMWIPSQSRFYPGFDTTFGTTGPNTSDFYLDTQSWAILSLGSTGSLGQAFQNGLNTNCNEFFEPAGFIHFGKSGIAGFFDYHPVGALPTFQFVWTEGTLGMIAAMKLVSTSLGLAVICHNNGRDYGAADLLASMNAFVDPAGGLSYATETTNADFVTGSSVAGTSWLYFANQGINPFSP